VAAKMQPQTLISNFTTSIGRPEGVSSIPACFHHFSYSFSAPPVPRIQIDSSFPSLNILNNHQREEMSDSEAEDDSLKAAGKVRTAIRFPGSCSLIPLMMQLTIIVQVRSSRALVRTSES